MAIGHVGIVIQWIVAEMAMWLIEGLLPEKGVRVLRAIGKVVLWVGVFLLLLGVTLALAVEDDWIVFLGVVVGFVGFLLLVFGGALRSLGTSRMYDMDLLDVVS
jgi:hypothetical protein|tara:strand:+ start:932 stop:1243 length:312 start_codon:yes stop_codon:yes gene_type:complete